LHRIKRFHIHNRVVMILKHQSFHFPIVLILLTLKKILHIRLLCYQRTDILLITQNPINRRGASLEFTAYGFDTILL